MRRVERVISGLALSAMVLAVIAGCSRKPGELPLPEKKAGEDVLIGRLRDQWSGDLDEILKNRRVIRVLVSYSKTNFAIAKGQPQGLEYELLHDYETFLRGKIRQRKIKPLVVFIAVPRAQLIPFLTDGRGDIAADLTVTPEREQIVSFSVPYIRDVRELIVTGKNVSGLRTRDDLSGRRVHVVAGSGYADHLRALNRKLGREGRRGVRISEEDKVLEAEDILEMVNAGIYDITVVDDYIAGLWSSVLPEVVVRKDIVLAEGTNIAWAVRKTNPQLLASLNEFIRRRALHGPMLGDVLLAKYYGSTEWIRNPLAGSERQKLIKYQSYIKEYAKKYGFDWLRIAAMAYQESHLDRNVRSRTGAVGIMQMLPGTAREVGMRDISGAKNNIHAGVKYLAYLRDTYFDDPGIAPGDKVDFALAAYNAGPTRIEALRRKAAEMGLDPDKWFFNVEQAALREIGWETVHYVSNIYKYYIAYRSAERVIRERSIEMHKAGKGS
jgi:membrane-bound lytic murein transglycosylase MltF